MGDRLPCELMTVRAGDVCYTDLVELPELVYVWRPSGTKAGTDVDPRWSGQLTGGDARLKYPRWHFVYDTFTSGDDLSSYACDLGIEMALQALHENYVVLRVGVEHPNDDTTEPAVRFVALHEEDFVRVRRVIPERRKLMTHWEWEMTRRPEWSENWRAWPHCNGQGQCWMHSSHPWCRCRCLWCRLAGLAARVRGGRRC